MGLPWPVGAGGGAASLSLFAVPLLGDIQDKNPQYSSLLFSLSLSFCNNSVCPTVHSCFLVFSCFVAAVADKNDVIAGIRLRSRMLRIRRSIGIRSKIFPNHDNDHYKHLSYPSILSRRINDEERWESYGLGGYP